MSRVLGWSAAYIVCVLAFSGIYYGFWCYKPDSFIVNGELNLSPLSNSRFYAWDDSLDEGGAPQVFGLSVISKDLEDIREKIIEHRSAFSKVGSDLELLRSRRHDLGRENEAEIFEKGKRYQEGYVADAHLAVVQAEKELEVFWNGLSEAQQQMSVHRVTEAEWKVKVARLRSLEARLAAEAANYFVANIGDFGNPAIVAELGVLLMREQELFKERSTQEAKLLELNELRFDKVERFRAQRISVLGWSDFIFFSVGISTTTTYGDVLGNSKVVRSIIAVQLLLCVFIVAGFLSSVISERVTRRCVCNDVVG